MSFLDSLENTLNNMEKGAERETDSSEQNRRKAERERALSAAPWADELKKGAWTASLMQAATREGFARRTKVYITWIGDTLRLEAREKRLELKPQAEGIVAQTSENGAALAERPVDVKGDPGELVREWLGAPAPKSEPVIEEDDEE
jgi:hypothetical protein